MRTPRAGEPLKGRESTFHSHMGAHPTSWTGHVWFAGCWAIGRAYLKEEGAFDCPLPPIHAPDHEARPKKTRFQVTSLHPRTKLLAIYRITKVSSTQQDQFTFYDIQSEQQASKEVENINRNENNQSGKTSRS